jgi:hypothetical protein
MQSCLRAAIFLKGDKTALFLVCTAAKSFGIYSARKHSNRFCLICLPINNFLSSRKQKFSAESCLSDLILSVNPCATNKWSFVAISITKDASKTNFVLFAQQKF